MNEAGELVYSVGCGFAKEGGWSELELAISVSAGQASETRRGELERICYNVR